MKKYLLSFLSGIIALASINAQSIIMQQPFTSPNWSSVDNNSSGVKWVYKYNTIELPDYGPKSFIGANQSNRFAVAIADGATGVINTDLKSPSINCTGHNSVLLEFKQWFATVGGATAQVFVSSDNTTWNLVYDATQSSSGLNPEVVDVDISAYAANQATVYLKFNYQISSAEVLWAIDDVTVMDLGSNDLSVTTVNVAPVTGITNNYTVKCTFINKGSTNINNLTLNYSINGSDPVSEPLTNLTLTPFQSVDYTFHTKASVAQAGTVPVVVYTSNPNGTSDDNTSNDSATQAVMFLDHVPVKNVLIEEFSTGPCGYCPGGAVYLEKTLEAANGHAIPVALHTGYQSDSMTTPDVVAIGNAMVNSAPNAAIDRQFFPNQDFLGIGVPSLDYYVQVGNPWKDSTLQRIPQTSPLAISANNIYDPSTRELNVTIDATFYGAISGNPRVSCYIIEDSIVGPYSVGENGYNQVSYYYSSPSDTSINPWYHQGINEGGGVGLINGYVHNHVVRYFMGGVWGTQSAFNGTPVVGQQYEQTFSYTLPAKWRDSHVSVVAFVNQYNQNPNSGLNEVYNVVSMPLNGSAQNDAPEIVLGVKETPAAIGNVTLYPNPANDQLYVNYTMKESAKVNFEVYNMMGQLVTTLGESKVAQGSYTALVNTSAYESGIYFLVMKQDSAHMQTIKFVVSK